MSFLRNKAVTLRTAYKTIPFTADAHIDSKTDVKAVKANSVPLSASAASRFEAGAVARAVNSLRTAAAMAVDSKASASATALPMLSIKGDATAMAVLSTTVEAAEALAIMADGLIVSGGTANVTASNIQYAVASARASSAASAVVELIYPAKLSDYDDMPLSAMDKKTLFELKYNL